MTEKRGIAHHKLTFIYIFIFIIPYLKKILYTFVELYHYYNIPMAMNTKFLLSSDNNNRSELLKKKIIHYYIANGDATIADLGREMDLSIPTVTKLVAELQDDGYILDFGKQETSGGRKPNIYGSIGIRLLCGSRYA